MMVANSSDREKMLIGSEVEDSQQLNLILHFEQLGMPMRSSSIRDWVVSDVFETICRMAMSRYASSTDYAVASRRHSSRWSSE